MRLVTTYPGNWPPDILPHGPTGLKRKENNMNVEQQLRNEVDSIRTRREAARLERADRKARLMRRRTLAKARRTGYPLWPKFGKFVVA